MRNAWNWKTSRGTTCCEQRSSAKHERPPSTQLRGYERWHFKDIKLRFRFVRMKRREGLKSACWKKTLGVPDYPKHKQSKN